MRISVLPMLVLAGCVTVNAPNPTPQRAAADYVTVYCATSGTSAYMIAAPSSTARCNAGDAQIGRDEYERINPPGAQINAFLERRAPGSVVPVKPWTSASSPGDDSVFTFRDWRIGDDLEREFAGYSLGRVAPNRPHCDIDFQSGRTWCEDRSILRRSSTGEPQAFLGDLRVDNLVFHFLDRKLYGFELNFPTPAFERLGSELRSRYGAPHRTDSEVIQNRAGARFDVKVAILDTPHGPMILRSRYESVNTGTLLLFDAAAEAELARRTGSSPKPKSMF